MNLGDSGPIAVRGVEVLKFRIADEDEVHFLHPASELNELRDIDGGMVVDMNNSHSASPRRLLENRSIGRLKCGWWLTTQR